MQGTGANLGHRPSKCVHVPLSMTLPDSTHKILTQIGSLLACIRVGALDSTASRPYTRAVNDQHVTAIATVVQDGLLFLSAVLISWYLWETRKLRTAAEQQVEAAFRPAIIVTHKGSLDNSPMLENIGNGPAMEVSWSLSDSDFSGDIPFVQPHQPQELQIPGMKPIYEAGYRAKSSGRSHVVRIECSYRSLSGRQYRSSSAYDSDRPQFVTRFTDDGAATDGSPKN